jgi:mRNA interferase MazF
LPHSPTGIKSGRSVLTLREEPGPRVTLAAPDVTAAEPGDAPPGLVVLVSAPKIRAVYWCRFWHDALRPEFYKNRPVVIVSRDNRLDGPALVVPLTTKPQGTNKWAFKLTENPNPAKPAIDSWAICNHIYAVSCARLAQMDGGVPRMKQQDFDEIVRLMLRALPNAPAAAR